MAVLIHAIRHNGRDVFQQMRRIKVTVNQCGDLSSCESGAGSGLLQELVDVVRGNSIEVGHHVAFSLTFSSKLAKEKWSEY